MVDQGSVTLLLNRLAHGDESAFDSLWSRYFGRIVGVAREKLRRLAVRAADEEDVALSAFHQFYRAASDRRFAQLDNRDDLWRVLVLLTARKAVDYHKHQARSKRMIDPISHAETASNRADPAVATLLADECRRMLETLPGDGTRTIAQLKLDGFSNEEIAARLGCTVRTVGRRLVLIRSLLKHDAGENRCR